MKNIINSTIAKKIIIVFLTIIMLNNFIMPNYVCAASGGEKLAEALFYLIAKVGDIFIKIMQYMMVGDGDIKTDGNYEIKYSPGLIFSNSILALDVNFIDPNNGEMNNTDTYVRTIFENKKASNMIDELEKKYGYSGTSVYDLYDHTESWTYGRYKYTMEIKYIYNSGMPYTLVTLYQATTEGTIASPAYKLQSHISSGYKALRKIALVGLLSVLLYIGIRIILSSSSSKDKSKYQNMLKDWLVAICIVFTLHYIMAFILTMTDSLNNIIKNNVTTITSSSELEVDTLMSNIRNKIGDDTSGEETAGYTIMYLTLVILTGIFTVQYLKRVIYMAFLTMIAPMIALTYPLDKIKDNKAQAFSFWLREYIFNCLIQPVHLLLYTLLITKAGEFAEENILYAIVALAFLVPAEKFIKEMFGMKSQSPVGTLGAAAGGAMVMSMLNKVKSKPSKDESSSGSPKGVRTATRTPSTPSGGTQGAQNSNEGTATLAATPQAGEMGGGAQAAGNGSASAASNAGSTTIGSGATNASTGATANATSQSSTKKGGIDLARGLDAFGKKNIYGPDVVKSRIKKLARSLTGGVAGATIGLAAGLATGDASNVLKYGAAGGAAGYAGVGNIASKFASGYDTIKEGAMGSEAYNNAKFDKQFYKSDGYKNISQDEALLQQYGGEKGLKDATQQFLDNGITDASEIRSAMQGDISADRYKELKSAGISGASAMKKIQTSASLRGLSGDEIKYRKIIAEAAKNKGVSGRNFINYARTFGMTEVQATDLQKNIRDYLTL